MNWSKKIIAIGLAAVTLSTVAGVAVTNTSFFDLTRAENTYYCNIERNLSMEENQATLQTIFPKVTTGYSAFNETTLASYVEALNTNTNGLITNFEILYTGTDSGMQAGFDGTYQALKANVNKASKIVSLRYTFSQSLYGIGLYSSVWNNKDESDPVLDVNGKKITLAKGIYPTDLSENQVAFKIFFDTPSTTVTISNANSKGKCRYMIYSMGFYTA